MKKKILCFFTIFCLLMPCVFTLAGCFGSDWEKYYVDISSAKDFIKKIKDSEAITSEDVYDRRANRYTYTLKKDLDFSGIDYKPIGVFYDILDGNGHTIKNLTINSTDDNIGLFKRLGCRYSDTSTAGTVLNAEIKNIKFENLTIVGSNNVGAIAGCIDNINTEYGVPVIQNVEVVSGSITGRNYVGGLIGKSDEEDIIIDNCSSLINRADVTGYQHVGGIFGYFSLSDTGYAINDFQNYGNVTSRASFYPTTDENKLGNAGGVFGAITVDNRIITLENFKNFGNVTCEDGYYVGGIVGNVYYKNLDVLSDCRYNGVKFKSCVNYGNIYGRSSVGGIAGQVAGKHGEYESILETNEFSVVEFTACKNHGRIESNDQRSYAVYDEDYKDDGFYVGGIIGRDFSTIAVFERCKNLILTPTEVSELGIEYDADNICIKGVGRVGGISGAYGLTFNSCSNDMDIYLGTISSTETTFSYAGGICGYSYSNTPDGTKFNALKTRTFNGCTNLGDIIGVSKNLVDETYYYTSMGGIAGVAGHVDMDNCSNTGNIYGNRFVGGIFGEFEASNNSNLYNVSNTGTIYADVQALAIGSIVGYARGTTGVVTMNKITINGSVETKGSASNVAGLYGYWGDIQHYQLGSDIFETTQTLDSKLSLSNVTYNFSIGKQSSATYNNLNSICGCCSNPSDTLAVNNSYTLELTTSTY